MGALLAIVLLNPSLGLTGQSNSSTPLTRASVTGCLGSSSNGFDFTDKDGNWYRLAGATSGLRQYIDDLVEVTGTIDKSGEQLNTFSVTAFRLVSKLPSPSLDAAFLNTAAWRQEEKLAYGLKFSYPENFITRNDREFSPNFPIQDGTVALGTFEIAGIYDKTNFQGGSFALFVNPLISNRESCEQFERANPKEMSSFRLNGIHYAVLTEAGAAAGTADVSHYLHTFQNGLCYEFGFDFAEVNTHNYDLWCTIPSLSEADEWNVIRPLLRGLLFIKPEPAVIRESTGSAARVISFIATPAINSITKQPETTLSWSTENVDYIELSYACPKGSKGMAILEDDAGRGCGGPFDQSSLVNRSANGSVNLTYRQF